MNATHQFGELVLRKPDDLTTKEAENEISKLDSELFSGDTKAAVATAIKAAEVISIVESDVEEQEKVKGEILTKLAEVPVSTHHDVVETLGAVDTVLTSGDTTPGDVLKRAGAETLSKVSQSILDIANPTVNEKESVEKQAELALVVAGKLLHMRETPSGDANLANNTAGEE